jgi:CheY-like chemotaxis protein
MATSTATAELAARHPQILLVDDAPEFGQIVRVLGRRAGHDVVVCLDVPSAWDVLATLQPDLVLLDVNLHGFSGLDLGRRIRSDPQLCALRLALFSSWQMKKDIRDGLEAGMDFLVTKDLITQPKLWPVRIGEILVWIRGQQMNNFLQYCREYPEWTLPSAGIDWVEENFRHPSLNHLDATIVHQLICRSLRQVFGPGHLETSHSIAWILERKEVSLVDLTTFLRSLNPSAQARIMGAVLVVLVEQVWCLLGTEATAAFRTRLLGYFPELARFLVY